MTKFEFIRFLEDSGCLKFGAFTLKSGDRSPFFINLGQVYTGKELTCLGDVLAAAADSAFPGATVLFGPAYKGIPMVTAAAQAMARGGRTVAICYDRKEDKGHGERGTYIGTVPSRDDRVVIVDDVLSSGGTKVAAMEKLARDFGVAPEGVLVAVDRRREVDAATPLPFPLHAVVNIVDLADYLADRSDPRGADVRNFYQGDTYA